MKKRHKIIVGITIIILVGVTMFFLLRDSKITSDDYTIESKGYLHIV